jgi:predicted nucleotidyltransferase
MRGRFEIERPSFVHGRPVREHLISAALDFVAAVSQMQGVERISLVGSICTTKPNPKDVDVLVTISPSVDMEKLATLGRKLKGKMQGIGSGADIFLADPAGRYLGRTCSWKECHPRASCEALNCGAYLYDDLRCLTLDRELIANPPIVLHPRIIVRDELPEDLMHEVKIRFEGHNHTVNRTSFREHFSNAVLTLATHRGGIKERLVLAGLELAKISEKEYDLMPGDLGEGFERFMDRLTDGGPISETVKALTEGEAEALAHDFWGLWEKFQSIPADILVSYASDIHSKRV